MTNTLSIIIPCYNEGPLIQAILQKISTVNLEHNIAKQIIIVDDGSTDTTEKTIREFMLVHSQADIVFLQHKINKGKGACIKKAMEYVAGNIVIIQDADLEYDPTDYNRLLQPILDGHADVVYGSRFRGSEPHRVLFFFHTIGNKFLTFLSNLLTQLNLTDMETGYKMFKTEILKKIKLKENRFGFEVEVTARISRLKKIRIYEVGISYYGRGYEEGKKIKWHDGLRAIYCIIKYNIFSR
ncbi:MAG: glycosyltransferase family 2 protein [Bacteroidetes bacterium]|nr:glycosyltransferase family 2 protein [Bacteroidota bacterium]MBS1608502.1 glycosyltransferase family 2 protein [Bacteroidota bacterium]